MRGFEFGGRGLEYDRPQFGGFRLLSLGDVESTNDIALELARAGEPGDLVVRAISQSKGRGQHARKWLSPPGNLYCSIILRPGLPLQNCSTLSLVAALALRDAVEAVAPDLVIELKWPNDILIGAKKLAGILLEGEAASMGCPALVILGFGVNLESSPGWLRPPVTDLAAEGFDVKPLELLRTFLQKLYSYRRIWLGSGFAALQSSWMRHAFGIGRPATVHAGKAYLHGTFQGVDKEGNLRILPGDGKEVAILSGQLSFDLA